MLNRIPTNKGLKAVTIGSKKEIESFFDESKEVLDVMEFASKGRLSDTLYAVSEYKDKCVITPLDYRSVI